jgi:hypothetical protein
MKAAISTNQEKTKASQEKMGAMICTTQAEFTKNRKDEEDI